MIPDFSNKKKQSNNRIVCDKIVTSFNKYNEFIKYDFANFSVNNYLIILGNKSEKGIAYFNNIFHKNYPKKTLVAYDIFGGLFALNQSQSNILYFAPDSLEWENLNIDYDTFISWLFTEDINLFYDFYLPINLENYEFDIFDEKVLSTYPFFWTEEYDPYSSERKIVSFQALFDLNIEFIKQLS